MQGKGFEHYFTSKNNEYKGLKAPYLELTLREIILKLFFNIIISK